MKNPSSWTLAVTTRTCHLCADSVFVSGCQLFDEIQGQHEMPHGEYVKHHEMVYYMTKLFLMETLVETMDFNLMDT